MAKTIEVKFNEDYFVNSLGYDQDQFVKVEIRNKKYMVINIDPCTIAVYDENDYFINNFDCVETARRIL